MGCNDFIRQLEGDRRDRDVRMICDCREVRREQNRGCGCRSCQRHHNRHHHHGNHHHDNHHGHHNDREREYICRCRERRN